MSGVGRVSARRHGGLVYVTPVASSYSDDDSGRPSSSPGDKSGRH